MANNIIEFWLEHYIGRTVTHQVGRHSIDNMDDQELAESIVEDILTFTILCEEFNTPGRLTMSSLTNQLATRQQKRRVHAIFNSELVHPYIAFDYTENPHHPSLSIAKDYHMRRAAMEYCGVYFAGYGFPGIEKPQDGETSLLETLYQAYLNKGKVKLTFKEVDEVTGMFFEALSGVSVDELVFELNSGIHNAVEGNTTIN